MAAKKQLKSPKKKVEIKLKINIKTILIGLFFLFLFLPFILSVGTLSPDDGEVTVSQALTDIKEEKIVKVEIQDNKLFLTYKDESVKVALKEDGVSFSDLLKNSDINPDNIGFEVVDQSTVKAIAEIAGIILPIGLMAIFFFYILRAQNKGAQDVFSFGRSKAKLFAKGKQDTTFADVAGVDDAKKELEEIVDFLKSPSKYQKIGARTPKGVLLFGLAGVGKCVTGDSLVWTNKGLMEIKDIPRYFFVNSKTNKVYGANLPSFDLPEMASKNNYASHWFDLGEQETVKLRLQQGFSLEGTPEHPVVVMGNDGKLKFRRLDQIKEGDFAAIQFGREVYGDLNLVDEDTAYLMGILTGDGNMSHSSRIGLTSVDSETVAFFKNYVSTRFAKSAITPNGQSYLVSSWDFKKFLYEMGMSYLLSFDKVVPPTILQAPKKIQKAFIQGLFDADASVEKNRATVEYTTVSEKLARQIQMMLLNMGVIASLNVKGWKAKGYFRDVYRITLTGISFKVFAEKVGFRLSRKIQKLNQHALRMKRLNTNVDIIPNMGKMVIDSWKRISIKKLSNEILGKVIDKVRRRGRVTRQVLCDYVDYARRLSIEVPHLEYLRSLVEENLFFSKVVEKNLGYAKVYDFTVPKTHSFISNGFISHNTLLAKAVAGEAGVPFFSMAGSEFMEMLVGVGASRVRDLFLNAKKSAPSIIFIDEIDAIGRQRGRGVMGGHDEREQTLNQILVEMDGFTPNDNVIVIAATNRGDLLDPALLRPGRFDRRVVLDMPDKEGREEIIKIHARGKKFVKGIDWGKIADRTVGFSGADIENMLNEAAIAAARDDKKEIEMEDVEEAATKVKLGPAKRRLQREEDKKITAYHEAGHAVVSHMLKGTDPVERISIVARGMSLGHTLIPLAADRAHETKSRMLDQITAMLGGRAAEEVVFNEMTSGASNDIEKATQLARAMVSDFGMSSLGPINLGPQHDMDDFGKTMWYEPSNISPHMQEMVDMEVKKIVDSCYKKAIEIVRKERKKLNDLSGALLKNETLDRDEFEKIVGKKM